MDILLIPVFLGFVAFAVVLYSKKTNAAWEEAGRKLRLKYSGGSFSAGRQLYGEVEGQHVFVDVATKRSGGNKRSCTRYKVRFSSAGVGMRLHRKGTSSRLSKLFVGNDVEVGDPLFDKRVSITARDVDGVRSFLTAERRSAIMRALARFSDCEITDSAIVALSRGVERQAPRLASAVRTLVGVARDLESQSAHEAPRPLELATPASARDPLLAQAAAEEAPGNAPLPELEEVTGEAELFELVAVEEIEPSEHEPGPAALEPETASETPLEDLCEEVTEARSDLDEVSLEGLSEELFDSNRMGSEAQSLFEERYANRSVRWTGVLLRVERYLSDRIFPHGPGVKAIVELPVKARGRGVSAVVQVSADTGADLEMRVGQEVTLGGRLVRCDPFLRHLFLAASDAD